METIDVTTATPDTLPKLTDVDPHDFYSVRAAAKYLRISRPTLAARLGNVIRDEFGRIPGYEVLRLGGIDWRVELAREPRGDVRKRIREII